MKRIIAVFLCFFLFGIGSRAEDKINVRSRICPDEKPLLENGECFPCDTDFILDVSEDECLKCAKHREYNLRHKKCVLKYSPYPDRPLVVYMWSIYKQKPRTDFYECDESWDLVSKASCSLCPDREFKGGRCIFKVCPNNLPVRLSDGSCLACSALLKWLDDVSEAECLKCSGAKYIDGKCILDEDKK